MTNIFIPKKIRIGFQERYDTFTGKLAYIIYFDEKNKICKEKSWKNWCNKEIPFIDMENKALSGFVINKGTQRDGSYFGNGRSMVRIYHPDDFEFEITVTNLMGILKHSNVSHRDINTECILAWERGELILLPTNSQEYKEAISFTEKQSKTLSTKDLVLGKTYHARKSEETFTYIGYYEWFDFEHSTSQGKTVYNETNYSSYTEKIKETTQISKGKKHVFWDGHGFDTPSISRLSSESDDEISPEFSHLVEKFFTTKNYQPIVDFEFSPLDTQSETMKIDTYTTFFKINEDKTKITIIKGNYNFLCDYPTPLNGCQNVFNEGVLFTITKNDKNLFHFLSSSLEKPVINIAHTKDEPTDEHTLCLKDFIKNKEKYNGYVMNNRAINTLAKLGFGKVLGVLKNGHKIPLTSLLR